MNNFVSGMIIAPKETMKWVLAISLLCSLQVFSLGQEAMPLTNDFPFKEGVYMSFEEFKGDNPTYGVGEFKIDEIDTLGYDLSKVKTIKILSKKGKWKTLSIKKVWGLSYQDVPYIFYKGAGNINSPISSIDKLTRIDVIGSICMFRLEHVNVTHMTNSFVSKARHKESVFIMDMIMDMNSGRIHKFDFHNVKHYIRSDEELLYELDIHRYEINLYDIVFAFNNRHPVYPSSVSYFEK